MSIPSSCNSELWLLANEAEAGVVIAICSDGTSNLRVITAHTLPCGRFRDDPCVADVNENDIEKFIDECIDRTFQKETVLVCRQVYQVDKCQYYWLVVRSPVGKVVRRRSNPFMLMATSSAVA